MDRLALVAGLNRNLEAIAHLGGDPSLHVEIPPGLLQELRSHVFRLCDNQDVPPEHAHRFPFEALTEPQYFARAMRFAIVQLRQTGVPEELHPRLLRGALDLVARGLFKGAPTFHRPPGYIAENETLNFQELLVRRITRCFYPGYYPDLIAHYDLLEEHGLIAWSSASKAWQLTNLGRYAQGLLPFSLLLFLLGVQLSLGREQRGSRFMTRSLINRLLELGAGQTIDWRGQHLPHNLIRFGIVDQGGQGKYLVSQFGYQLLKAVHDREDQLRDLIHLLLESEIHGFTLGELTFSDGGISLAVTGHQSLTEAATLAKAGKHLEALRLLYPSIEALLNSLLEEEGLNANQLAGLHKKFEELIRIGRLPPRLGHWGEIVMGRNKIVHGNIRDGADDLCAPLYNFVLQFFVDLMQETRSAAAAGNNERSRTTQPLQSDLALRVR